MSKVRILYLSILINSIVEENKQGTADINVKLEDFTSNTRVHILANQF
jgi:hypothetical protein